MFGRIGGGSKSGGNGSHESKSGGSICGIDRKDIRSVIHVSTTNKNDFKAVCFTTPKGPTDCIVSHYVEPGAGNRGGDGSHGGSGSYSASQGSQTAHYSESYTAHRLGSIPTNHKLISQSPHDYSNASIENIDTHFAWAFDNTNGRLDLNGFVLAGNIMALRGIKHLLYLTKTYDVNVLQNKKCLNFGFNLMNDAAIDALSNFLYDQELHLDELNLKANCITDVGCEFLFYRLRNASDVIRIHEIKSINLSGNNIGDYGALYIAESLKSARFPHLKSLDVSGNQITKTGTGYFLDALKNSNVGNIIIKQYHLSVFGNKENKISFMKDYLKQAQDKGVDVKNIVVDKSLIGYIKTTSKVVKDVAVGFAKCYYVDDAVTDYAADKIIAKVSKTFGMFWNGKDVVNCYAESFDDVMISEIGVELIKNDLEIMGEATFINAIE
jgi:hypothetical protein